jgi:hypothetical protein
MDARDAIHASHAATLGIQHETDTQPATSSTDETFATSELDSLVIGQPDTLPQDAVASGSGPPMPEHGRVDALYIPIVRRQNLNTRERRLVQIFDEYAQDTRRLLKELSRQGKISRLQRSTTAITCPLVRESLINHGNHPTLLSRTVRDFGATWPFVKKTSAKEFSTQPMSFLVAPRRVQ